MNYFFHICVLLFLSIAAVAQEIEEPIYCNPALVDASNEPDKKLFKDALVYPLHIAGKNLIEKDSVVFSDTLVFTDTLKLLLYPTILTKDTSIAHYSIAGSDSIEFVYRPADTITHLLQRTINIFMSGLKYRNELFAGMEMHLIDTNANTNDTLTRTISYGDFILYDTLCIFHDTSVITKIRIVRRSLIDIETIKINAKNCFFDDFSFSQVYPNQHLWTTKSTYINNSYGRDPVSIGVATFDALDERGHLYENTSSVFRADTLESKSINFADTAISNVYLSFYFQPAGYGEDPDKNDQLLLEFYSPVKDQWDTIAWSWFDKNDSVTSDKPNITQFRLVHIPITDTNHLKNGFRFRFVNMVSYDNSAYSKGGKGNCDVWNVDYVYLAANRCRRHSF